jgi:hypothetical protein
MKVQIIFKNLVFDHENSHFNNHKITNRITFFLWNQHYKSLLKFLGWIYTELLNLLLLLYESM